MPGRLFLSTPLAEIAAAAGVGDGLSPQAPRVNISPGQQVVTLTRQGLTEMRWGIIPVGVR